MNGYWAETRPNGKPLEEGQVCWVTQMEGINPIYTYGKSKDEVIEKLARTNANAQAALARRSQQPSPAAPATPAAPRPSMSADDVMRATQDLKDPATAGRAVVQLVQEYSGVDLDRLALEGFANMAVAWEHNHPDFYPHPGNKRLLADRAKSHAGGNLAKVTPEILTQAFNELQSSGYLFEPPIDDSLPPNNQPSNLTTFPGESPVQRTERPRGARFATGVRSTQLRAPQNGQPRTLKYTEAEIRSMPTSKSRALIESNDKDYADACETYFGATG